MWYVMNLTYYKGLALNIHEYNLFFKGETFIDKMDDYYNKDEYDGGVFLGHIGRGG